MTLFDIFWPWGALREARRFLLDIDHALSVPPDFPAMVFYSNAENFSRVKLITETRQAGDQARRDAANWRKAAADAERKLARVRADHAAEVEAHAGTRTRLARFTRGRDERGRFAA